MSETAPPAPEKRWFENVWVALLAGYVFAPLGMYLMWRYQPWPVWVKVLLTAIGLVAAVVGTYVSTKYVTPALF